MLIVKVKVLKINSVFCLCWIRYHIILLICLWIRLIHVSFTIYIH